MTTSTTTRPPSVPPASTDRPTGLRLSPGTHQRRPWQIVVGIAFVVVCAAAAGAAFQSTSQNHAVVIATKNLPAGTVLTAADLSSASIPSSANISAMSAVGASVLVGQQINTGIYAGEVLVKAMLASAPQLAAGDQVVGMMEKGDQMPSAPLVVGDTVSVIAVPQAGQGTTISGTIGTVLVAAATIYAVGPAPANQSQFQAQISLEVPAADAPAVASYAAADQIGLSLVGEGSS